MSKVNLLRIKFANILSFKDEQEIFFTADSKYTNSQDAYIKRNDILEKESITPVCVLYGANASGKSNVIKVFNEVLASLLKRGSIKKEDITRQAFLLDDTSKNNPSFLEVDFIANDTRYVFSCNFDDNEIITESLTSFVKKDKVRIYDRNKDEIKSPDKALTKFDIQYAKDLFEKRKDVLLLDILDTRGVEDIKKANNAISEATKMIMSNILSVAIASDDMAEALYENDELHKKVVALAKYADLGITNIIITLDDNPNRFSLSKSNKSYNVEFEHRGEDGKKYNLPLLSQSFGTGQFIRYLISFIPAFINGGVFIIDEMEENLHPIMLKKIIEMFNHPEINSAGAQLIFTTHNTSLLRPNVLKRDEIWLVEKNTKGCSEVYPLTDFNAVREGFNHEKGYLEGRFGAIPYLDDINNLVAVLNEKE